MTINKNKKILIVDDEDSILRFLQFSLEQQGYQVRAEKTGAQAIQATIEYRPQLIILDLGLPDMEGQSVLKKIRDWSSVPILILTANESINEKVNALDQGADDYLTKPFSLEELLARLRVALRHSDSIETSQVYILRNLKVDFSAHLVWLDNKEVRLTVTEYDILKILVKNAGKVVTHRNLLKEIWGPNSVEHTQYLRVYVGQLRKKLSAASEDADFILTEPGVGYRLIL